MDFLQKRKFAELRKKNNYEIAQQKDLVGSLTEEELFHSLLIQELSESITQSVNEFYKYGEHNQMLSYILSVLGTAINDIIIDQKLTESQIDHLFNIIKGGLNDHK
jgi:hypothetical protein